VPLVIWCARLLRMLHVPSSVASACASVSLPLSRTDDPPSSTQQPTPNPDAFEITRVSTYLHVAGGRWHDMPAVSA
jgi:hypothetical protein